jgi:post-GPI attachment to proteins factor 3
MILRQQNFAIKLLFLLSFLALLNQVSASYGDRLPEFRQCVEVSILPPHHKYRTTHNPRSASKRTAKEQKPLQSVSLSLPFFAQILTPPALHHKLLLWTCPSECDYTCQHIITSQRVASSLPIVQFHGKWPFYRFLGMQEPFSVFFSLLNFLAHQNGLDNIKRAIPPTYPLRKYYVGLSYFGMVSWVFSMIFHTRDFAATEQLDYFAAGASVLYGFYYTPIRVFRLDQGGGKGDSVVRAWGLFCITLYICHVTYLKLYSWDYTYNMAANVVIGIIQNLLWTWWSWRKYRDSGRPWAMLPGLVVVFVLGAMSLELLDFAPIWGCLDAHSLWHLATVAPTMIFYK